MKRAVLVLRIPTEALLGVFCLASALVLLPWTLQGYFPVALVVGYLGMPRRVVSPVPADVATASRHLNEAFMALGFLIIAVIFLSALLWFRDVVRLIGRLRMQTER